MMGFRFQDPLWLLLLVPLLAMGWWQRRRRPAAVVYSNVDILKTLPARQPSACGGCCRGSPWRAWR